MLGDDLDAALPELRAHALSRMRARVTIRRTTGDTTLDEGTGAEVPVWAVVGTDVPFRLDGASTGDGGSRTVTIGGVEFEQATGIGHLPYDWTALADGDYVEVTGGQWAGTVVKVVKATKKDQATARRVPIQEVSRPAEWE